MRGMSSVYQTEILITFQIDLESKLVDLNFKGKPEANNASPFEQFKCPILSWFKELTIDYSFGSESDIFAHCEV